MDIFSIFSFSSDFVEMMVRFVICTLFNWLTDCITGSVSAETITSRFC